MDPTHFLASQHLQGQCVRTTSPGEIEAFYDENGLDWLVALSRWQARLSSAWQRRKGRSAQPSVFAPAKHRG